MFALQVRIAQFLEALLYVAVARWIVPGAWRPFAIAGLVVAGFLAARLALVLASMGIGWLLRSPREPRDRIGALRAIAMVAGEWRALLAANLVDIPWERRRLRADPAPEPGAGIPVLLVHGYFANRGYLRPLVRRLESRNVAAVFVPNFPATGARIEVFEAAIAAAIERITTGTGQPKVVLVGHSMGGLAARACVARGGGTKVARLVTIGAPHHGTALAAFGAGENTAQMARGSAFLAELERLENEDGPAVPALSLYSPHDNMVVPQASSRLAWARNVALPGYGHIALAGCEEVAQLVVEEIRAAAR